MLWSLWFLAPDIWLIHQVPHYGWWSGLIVMLSALINIIISMGIFFFLVYAVKRLAEKWPDRQVFVSVGNQLKVFLNRNEENGYRLARYIEKIRLHKYLFLYLLNVIPFVPWITGGTVCYTAVTKDFQSLFYIILGTTTKILAITGITFLVRT